MKKHYLEGYLRTVTRAVVQVRDCKGFTNKYNKRLRAVLKYVPRKSQYDTYRYYKVPWLKLDEVLEILKDCEARVRTRPPITPWRLRYVERISTSNEKHDNDYQKTRPPPWLDRLLAKPPEERFRIRMWTRRAYMYHYSPRRLFQAYRAVNRALRHWDAENQEFALKAYNMAGKL